MAEKRASRFDPTFTQGVIDAMGDNVTPRNKVLFTSLIKHIHDFAREVELTHEEWMTGVRFINSIGQASTAIRNEGQRVSDVLGLESLVDEIANKVIAEDGHLDPTSSSILGPFWSPDAPLRPNGASIIQDPAPPSTNPRTVLMHGTITDLVTGKPIPGAIFDIWQASSNGKYDFQDPDNQSPNNLRGKFRADFEGKYWLYCYRPTAYSLPSDGPAYRLLGQMDRHPMRPAHIHVMVTHPDYKGCTTQLYPKDDPWLETDTIFGVKTDLVVDFLPCEDPQADLDLAFDIVLAPKGYKGKQFDKA
ncbi:Catechol 1 [Escovopsis weberi]|uniref:Catechol 1 n=1 Tax=Escovopsis weberi TaxID=150374 RepID=A0A0M8N8S9_ESCWE|nr:Catechol 1 [Escovopsis weberi]